MTDVEVRLDEAYRMSQAWLKLCEGYVSRITAEG
jgi:hypothetical protein